MKCPECGIFFIVTLDDAMQDATPMFADEPIVVDCDSPYDEAEHVGSTGKAPDTECDGHTPLKERRDADRVRVMEQQLAKLSRKLAKLSHNQHQAQTKFNREKDELLAALEAAHKRELKREHEAEAAAADAKKTFDTYEQECGQLEREIDILQRGNAMLIDRIQEERLGFVQKFADQKQTEADATGTIRQLVEMVDEAMKSHWVAREVALDCHKFIKITEDHAKVALDRASKLDALKTVLAMNHTMQLQGTAVQNRVEAHARMLSITEVPRFDEDAPLPVEADCDDGNGSDDTGGNCVVCFERPRDTLFKPCGHAMCCSDCADLIRQQHGPCPICRHPIRGQMQLLTPEKADQIHEYYVKVAQQTLMEMYRTTMDTIKEESTRFQLEWAQGDKCAFDIVARLEDMCRRGVTSNVDTFRDTIFPADTHYWAEPLRSHAEHCLMDGSSDPALCNDTPPFEASAAMTAEMATQMTEYDRILSTHAQKRDSFDGCHLLERQRQMSEDIDTLNNKLNASMHDRHLDAKVRECVEEMFEIASGNAKDTKDPRQAVSRAASDLGQLSSDKQPAARADRGGKKGKKKKKK